MTATITIPLGARVRIIRPDGSRESYLFRGEDGAGLIFEDDSGNRHSDVLDSQYQSITIEL